MSSKRYESNSNNIYHMLNDRMQYMDFGSHVRRRLHAAPQFLRRLGLEAVLEGDDNSINCLEWSLNGRLLAAGTDETQLILWNPFKRKRLQTIVTEPKNIHSVKFLPKFNDSLIAIAAQRTTRLYDINNPTESLFTCVCHGARGRSLAIAPDSPYVFWSAGKDGVVLQLDHREKHVCRSAEHRVRLINLASHIDAKAEASCIAVNPMRTEFIAVGANDPYARVYDRRMLRTDSSAANGVIVNGQPEPCNVIPKDCGTYYCPGHISMYHNYSILDDWRTITYLTFNSTGTELLVNMGGEHIYLYDLHCAEQPVLLNLPDCKLSPQDSVDDPTGPMKSASHDIQSQSHSRPKLADQIEDHKKRADEFLENEKYYLAIRTYSDAISAAAKRPVLYLNRATAYMGRQWVGDVYAALKDCHTALSLDPTYVMAHLCLARSLLKLGRPHEADECLKELIRRFPSYATSHGVLMLNRDITYTSSRNYTPQQACVDNFRYRGKMSDNEFYWRCTAKDYKERFVGHCNAGIEIQEAHYFGNDGDFIVASSDDGNIFIWEPKSGNIHSIYKAGSYSVKCVLPHPEICLLASAINGEIEIWSPLNDDAKPNSIDPFGRIVADNQMKMNRICTG